MVPAKYKLDWKNSTVAPSFYVNTQNQDRLIDFKPFQSILVKNIFLVQNCKIFLIFYLYLPLIFLDNSLKFGLEISIFASKKSRIKGG